MLRVIDPRQAGDEEVVGVGSALDPETLRWAYSHGIFPWPMHGLPLLWFCPPQRAVLEFDTLHIPRRLARLRRHSPYTFTLDAAFDRVVNACRLSPRPGQDGTWITPALQAAFAQFHRTGDAHSVEAWDKHGALVGGLYGVASGGAFGGESMFHTAPNASKLALLFLIDHLKGQGVAWMDIQMMTPHMEALGARLIPRDTFLDKLEDARAHGPLRFNMRSAGYFANTTNTQENPMTPADTPETDDAMPETDDAMPETDDAMPQGAALARAEDELDHLAPGPADTPHFAPPGDAEQSIDEPMHDMLGRRDGP